MPVTEIADAIRIAARLEASVREAGALALSMFGRPIRNWTKDVSSPVCEADIAVDSLLRQKLGALAPGFGWLSEETADDPARLTARYIWIVDPIDGTRGYIAGAPDWAVSAALVEDGRPIVACLFAPVSDEFFTAIAGAGATCNEQPIRATSGHSLDDIRIAGPKNLLAQVASIGPPLTVMPRIHSLALRLARVAQGELDAAIAGGNSHDWDLAAADLLVHEAGALLTPLDGVPIVYNRPVPRHGKLVAAGRARHASLMELLRDPRLAAAAR